MECEFPDFDDEFDLEHEEEYEALRELEAAAAKKPVTSNTVINQGKTNLATQQNKANTAKDLFDLDHEEEYEILREIEASSQQKISETNSSQPKIYGTQKLSFNKNSAAVTDQFDLEHADDYEVLKELEASQGLGTNKNQSSQHKNLNGTQNLSTHKQNSTVRNLFGSQNESQIKTVNEKRFSELEDNDCNKKRSIDQVLKDISAGVMDSLFDDDYQNDSHQKKKPCWDQPQELMQLILDRRKNAQDGTAKSNYEKNNIQRKKLDSISRRVPTCNFVAVTRSEDGERFYIKMSEKNYSISTNNRMASNTLLKSFSQLKDEAEQIILKNAQKSHCAQLQTVNSESLSCELWVDKYRPKRYLELLSDENVNRSLLYWLKLWDKIVFDRDPTVHQRKQVVPKFKNKFKKKEEDIPDHDSKGFPTRRIALLTGPPGLGKTTLAHVATKHAGYNVVELNASDDRGPEAFREALLASTQMRAVIDQEKRPNCLILDEIDGAPAASIELLLKFIQGKLAPKGRKAKDKPQKQSDGCRRPVICICNDLYAPSLRPLRAMALVINVPEISPSSLADRLMEITQAEGIHVDSRLLLQLAERSACDVRACLSTLQYTGGRKKMLQDLAFGTKDMKKGIFDAWREMLQIPFDRKGFLTEHARVQKVILMSHQVESDRLVQGVFHNYPEVSKEKLIHISESLHWFEFYDEINTTVMERQSWMLMPYVTSAFVAWHLYLAGSQPAKVSYPTAVFEANQKRERNMAILQISKKTCKQDILSLVSEIFPYLPDLLTPRLRSVNAQLYSPKEKAELARLINLMLDFGLTFTQMKKAEGGYEYFLDPNIWDIGTFPECKVRKPLPYAVKQIVIQGLETERLRRAAIQNGEAVAATPVTASSKEPAKALLSKKGATPLLSQSSDSNENVPNHLRQLNPIEIQPAPEEKCRNFFRNFQLLGEEKHKKQLEEEKAQGIVNTGEDTKAENERKAKRRTDLLKHDYWYQYKEGYSNAVRRTVYAKDL